MDMIFETERLTIKILPDTAAAQVLRFYTDNKEIFEACETDRPEPFYTEDFQKAVLNGEYNLAVKQTLFRFWVFEKENQDRIIGTISFQHIKRGYFQTCELGYKFDRHFWGRGYARESISRCIQIAFGEWKLHRIEAYVLPENTASRKLLAKLGFEWEGTKKQSVKLHDVWRDQEIYALLSG